MHDFLSPNYTHDKLANVCFADFVDVFEDMWRHYMLVPCEMLLRFPHGEVGAMMLLSSYFEAIWIHLSGNDSNGKSKLFFVRGFCRVFRSESAGIDRAAEAIYEHVRCGLDHEGSLRRKVNYSGLGAKPFYLTYPKKPSGELDLDARVTSIVVNPHRVYEGVKTHFESYVRELREAKDMSITVPFRETCERLWGLGEGDNIVGMTEAEFRGEA